MLGAFYLDGKEHELRILMMNLFDEEITLIDESELKYNPKAILQEYAQSNAFELPEYKLVSQQGPAHDKTFVFDVLVNSESVGKGEGKSKKEAQQNAAKEAVETLGILKKEGINE